MGDSGATPSESLFAKLVVEQGLASESHVRECLDIIGRLAAEHVTPVPRLGELLVRKGYLSPQQLEVTLKLPARSAAPTPTPGNQITLPTEVAHAAEMPANRVGRYVRVKAIGAGGMGEVWSGW